MIQFEYRDLMWILGVGAAVIGALVAFLKNKLTGGDGFARASDMVTISNRVTSIEERLSKMPNHQDLQQLQIRVGDVERGVAVVAERVSGLGEIMKRVEHQTGLLVQHQLREGGG
ncbi:DUF2730 domain-containing protein [Roseomonas sp. HJA6]|uniref:DUF2730 domain-containing protein n=1 Tax=Roseomonas alba TaxID=2846776 RepID=A0ABS7AL37_9PROT|nr:DUF2730 domain-containing protein [Neoroseomonas alba]